MSLLLDISSVWWRGGARDEVMEMRLRIRPRHPSRYPALGTSTDSPRPGTVPGR
ncbi:MAG: hypothetical protein ABR972_07970 [Acidimicrobiales bacterium]|jgi:hypothetical protein